MSGYIGTQPVPQATQTRQTFTATAAQTTFNTIGYTPRFLDVFLNGVKLVDGTDYTATNGSDVVLTTGAAASDILDVVAFNAFDAVSQNFTDGITVENDGATVIIADRQTSDGTIIDVQKNGTSVGSILAYAGDMVTGTGDVGIRWEDAGDLLTPWNPSTNLPRASAIDLGATSVPFKDLYLSGGVYLGGTGSANKLDDYEEGTWTVGLTFPSGSVTISSTSAASGRYTKIGNTIHVVGFMQTTSISSPSGNASLTGLPFTVGGGVDIAGSIGYNRRWATDMPNLKIAAANGGTTCYFNKNPTNGESDFLEGSDFSSGVNHNDLYFQITYRTN